MKYCLSGRQPLSVLGKCDEIKVDYNDKDRILDYIDILSTKTIILDVPSDVSVLNWQLLQAYASKIKFMLCLHSLNMVEECKEYNIDFYWAYPITSYYELRGLIELKPCYLFLGAPLSFDLPKVKAITDIPIRLCPNVAYDSYVPRADGICGQWIRPEDTAVYEQYVETYEFTTDELKREQVLFHIYKDNGNWPGNMNMLFTNFDVNVDNRGIPEELGEIRAKCGQRCMSNGTCHLCVTAIKFSETLRKKHEQTPLTEQN